MFALFRFFFFFFSKGYLGYVRSTLAADTPFTEDCFLRIPFIEAYGGKECVFFQFGCVWESLSTLLCPVKFLHRERAPDLKVVLIIQQIQSQATILQKQGDIGRPSTKEDLEALNRWISWTRDKFVGAVTAQRERFESTHPVKLKVRHCSDLALLSLFVYPPPSRGLKVRTLEIVRDRSTLDAKEFCDRNFLIVNKDGSGLRLQINRYKTKRFRGRDEVTIQVIGDLQVVLG
ncbi:uncharacterized protein [Montipora capricornis]|uniref:uncharacterized protein n=1 Tax=Montipora capricornis TaxID=246305 RepID=UPI0035F18062